MTEQKYNLKNFIDAIHEQNTFQPIRFFVFTKYTTVEEDLACTFFNWLVSKCYLRHAPHSMTGDVYVISKVGHVY